MITIAQMEYIVALEKERNFSRAAKLCNITQPTLSLQIQKAEELLQVVIFDRSKSPILITQVGEELVVQIKQVLKEYKKIENISNENEDHVSGIFKLGIIPTLDTTIKPTMSSIN